MPAAETGPLHKAKPGEWLKVKQLEAGRQMQLRISSMGLKIGDEIEVMSNGFGGQVVVASGDSRLVIGSGMAQKIWVEPVDTRWTPQRTVMPRFHWIPNPSGFCCVT